MKLDTLLVGEPTTIRSRAEALAATGIDGLFTFEGPWDVFTPLVLAAGGLVVGTVVLLLAGLVGVVRLDASAADVTYAVGTVPVWVPVAGLGVVAAAVAYVTGIAASRRLGSRLASFVALLEVLFALLFAWLLRDEIPAPVQFAGAALVLAGVVVVKLGERNG